MVLRRFRDDFSRKALEIELFSRQFSLCALVNSAAVGITDHDIATTTVAY